MNKPVFEPVAGEQGVDFVALERKWLERWYAPDQSGTSIINRYLTRNEASEKRFSFIDGPITANNPMGVHHAWGRTYKDLFLRFRNMQGYRQRFQNGYDGQGLWIEVEEEKLHGFKSKHEIEGYGVGKFVQECKDRVDRFADTITEQSKRLGYFMDWDDSYHTKSDENNYAIWGFLKTCHENGWLYEGEDVMPWCPRCGTGMSQHEIATEGYAEVVHPGLFLTFPLIDRSGEELLIWTTTPWTLAANVAAAVHDANQYVKVRNVSADGTERLLWLSANRLHILDGKHEVLEQLPGSAMVGWRYSGPFDDLPAQSDTKDAHRVIEWKEVGEDEGTGIVHIAPGAGTEDFQLGKENGLVAIAPLDEDGVYVDGFGELSGKSVDEVNPMIYQALRDKGIFYKVEDYTHRYPVCWRCGSELVFRLVDEWFISMDEVRHAMKATTKTIRWIPEFGLARELEWLDNMSDWMISKKRYYGLALPIYPCPDADCEEVNVIGSRAELEARAVEGWDKFNGNSPHRPWIDEVTVSCIGCGSPTERIKDVGNAWLDAGIVSFSTLSYYDDRDYWADWYPADWISESFPGQFRNWFYSLICMATVLDGTAPTKTVFSYGLMRDEHGEEMHKSKGNSIEFEAAADKMGADIMRWVYSRHTPQNNLNFGFSVGDLARRQFLLPLWNIYYFLVTYANLDGWSPSTGSGKRAPSAGSDANELDLWVTSELNMLVKDVTADLEDWRVEVASARIERFVDRLSNWYVRRSRRRFWKSDDDADKQSAYETLYRCVSTLSQLLAPFMPFISEEIYQNLVKRVDQSAPDSVHLSDWPVADASVIDEELSRDTDLAMRLSSLGRAARASMGVRVRQPLAELIVQLRHPEEESRLGQIAQQLRDELNVKVVRLASDTDNFLEHRLSPNFKLLGPKYRTEIGSIMSAIRAADPSSVAQKVEAGEQIPLGDFTLEPEEILVDTVAADGYAVESDGQCSVGISMEVDDDLIAEGMVRETAHFVQLMRKEAGLEISDRIVLWLNAESGSALSEVLTAGAEYIASETLAVSVRHDEPTNFTARGNCIVNGELLTIGLRAC